jgi:hypothetical protein
MNQIGTLLDFIRDIKFERTIDSTNSSINDFSIKTSTNGRFRNQIQGWSQRLKVNKFECIFEEVRVKSSNRNAIVDRPRNNNPYLNHRRWAVNPFRIRGVVFNSNFFIL